MVISGSPLEVPGRWACLWGEGLINKIKGLRWVKVGQGGLNFNLKWVKVGQGGSIWVKVGNYH